MFNERALAGPGRRAPGVGDLPLDVSERPAARAAAQVARLPPHSRPQLLLGLARLAAFRSIDRPGPGPARVARGAAARARNHPAVVSRAVVAIDSIAGGRQPADGIDVATGAAAPHRAGRAVCVGARTGLPAAAGRPGDADPGDDLALPRDHRRLG